ncbi:hypothetical protein [Streptomyces rugosispiralis]|uniref:Uncharacterized protein n=1 Tax=Streptomyces rugosispiralis TaxID=2967341 RepID=A0ABT1V8F0_9ACTN|nr:hypothetical protein [Streptomyces rugosispiralis]MCQ8193670.1 hypothetical protein [Streptomyces rugosispiralis]
MRGKADGDGQHKSGRMDLSVAHVAASALAAVAAAVLASKLGVYGTILGAGVVSVVATAGGTVIQHLFRRTGEQIKEVRVQTRPTGRRRYGAPGAPAEPVAPPPAPAPGEYGEPTTHGARPRVRRRHAVGAAAVFIAAMTVITGIEMFSGGPVSNVWGENRTGTTVSDSVSGSSGPKSTPGPSRRDPTWPSHGPGSSRGGEAPSPGISRGGGVADASATPDASGSPGSGKSSGSGSGQDGGTGGTTAPGTSAPATPGPSQTPSGGATEGGTGASGEATPTPGATGAP